MDRSRLKIVIFGAYNAGKSTFIRAIDPESHHIEANNCEISTTVGLDFGRTVIDNQKIYLFGTPGQDRFEFVRDILSRGMDGAIVVADTTRELDDLTRQICRMLSSSGCPYAVFLNKCDHPESCPGRYGAIAESVYSPEISAVTGTNTSEALREFVALHF
ncbi:GTP-binding protein [Methanogenium organophilum]|uniref:GTP-binding protein n=1 Tax=Methanogenium organophilum TaxID=2199 RepID=A0A9X9S3Z5_METOG|nr:GTP-binding protein [Methanogenium organophilum]WAI01504.1 GTP-binding protein [Methanogenium organophilum]